jgi:tetratricopeptide (TPR) repeat protein
MIARALLVVALATLGFSPGTAHAADAASKQAKAAYEEGQVAFNLGHWDQAIDAWQRGYKLKPDPLFLFNIGQANRQAGHAEQAVLFYKSYLHNAPDARNRDDVLKWIDDLEKQMAEERQRKADEEKRKAEDEQRRLDAEAAAARQRQEQAAVPAPIVERELRGDLGLRVGANLWLGLEAGRGVAPSAAIELTGGYTLVDHGRLRFRLGATFGFTYLKDLDGKAVNLISLMLDPTLKVDLWKKKLFFVIEVGLGAGILTGMKADTASALLHAGKGTNGGAFAGFEARPQVGIEYQPIRRLSVLLTPGVGIVTPPTKDFDAIVRLQIIAGVLVHL